MERMWRWLRRLYIVAMLAFPPALWWGLVALGSDPRRWVLPGRPNVLGMFIVWGIVWELMVLAPVLELPAHPLPPAVPARQELALWALYTLFALSISAYFAGLTWLTLLVVRFLERTLPASLMEAFGGAIAVLIWLALLAGSIAGAIRAKRAADAFRTALRYRVLGLHTSNATLLSLLEQLPLAEEVEARYRARLEGTEEVDPDLLIDLADALSELTDHPLNIQQQKALLQLEQALRNRLEEERVR